VAKSKKSSAASFKLRYSAEVTVSVPEVQLLPSLRYLDVEALSRASSAKVDVGFFNAPCCKRAVSAVIERGMVVKLEMSPCSDPTPLPREGVAFVSAALKRARSGAGKWKPVPVKEFLANVAQQVGAETNCIEFMILGHTIFCCRTGEGPISCVFVEPITVNRL
jgi:hypothetical protein